MKTRVCTRCGVEKSEGEFYVKNKATGQRLSRCKTCHCAITTENYLKNREENKEKRRKYAKEHKEQSAEQTKRWRAANPEKTRESSRRSEAKPETKARHREYKKKNADYIKSYQAEYRHRNRDWIKEQDAEYRRNNRELLRARQREWRKENPESNAQIHSRWKKANRAKVNAATHRRRARLAGCSGEWTAREWEDLKAACGHTCLCCGRCEPEIKLTVDHVIPVSRGGDNKVTNIQPLCKSCNSAKHTLDADYRG